MVGRLPPLFGHVNLGTQERLVPRPTRKAGEAKEVPCHIARRVSIGQKWCEFGGGVPYLLNFGLAQFIDYNGIRLVQTSECVRRKPVWLLDSKIAPRCLLLNKSIRLRKAESFGGSANKYVNRADSLIRSAFVNFKTD